METVRRLRERFPQLQDPPSDDICYATQNRQVAIKKVAKDADLVIVVGSANSSNSVRLVEVALEYGAKAAYRVDYADEVEQEWFDGVETVGVTSGASVPEVLVQEVLDDLADAGYRDVEEVKTARGGPPVLPPEGAATGCRGPARRSRSRRTDRRMSDRERPAHADATQAAIRRVRDPRGAARAHPAARSDAAARDRTGSRRAARSRAGRLPVARHQARCGAARSRIDAARTLRRPRRDVRAAGLRARERRDRHPRA